MWGQTPHSLETGLSRTGCKRGILGFNNSNFRPSHPSAPVVFLLFLGDALSSETINSYLFHNKTTSPAKSGSAYVQS